MRLACRPCSRTCLDPVTMGFSVLIFLSSYANSFNPPAAGVCPMSPQAECPSSPCSCRRPAFRPEVGVMSSHRVYRGHGRHGSRPKDYIVFVDVQNGRGVVVCKRTDDTGLARGNGWR